MDDASIVPVLQTFFENINRCNTACPIAKKRVLCSTLFSFTRGPGLDFVAPTIRLVRLARAFGECALQSGTKRKYNQTQWEMISAGKRYPR